VPIRPICELLGVSVQKQLEKIKEHPILSSVITLRVTVAADGKEREMQCLPFRYIFGWIFTINPENVKEEAKEALIKYQNECYNALYDYFTSRAEFVEQKQVEIDRQLEIVHDAKVNFKEAKNILYESENKLQQLRKLTLDDFDMERRQLKLNFD
jgi:hypothetical protein